MTQAKKKQKSPNHNPVKRQKKQTSIQKTTKSKGGKKKKENDDWISALVQKAASSSSSSFTNDTRKTKKKNGKTPTKTHPKAMVDQDTTFSNEPTQSSIPEHEIVLSKEERIQRRNLKKKRRLERMGTNSTTSIHEEYNYAKQQLQSSKEEQEAEMERTKQSLEMISDHIRTIVRTIHPRKKTSNSYYNDYYKIQTQNAVRGKATKNKLTDDNIQPRKQDYNGLGLARPSLLILLRDESFIPKFEEEFQEHVPGFFGKQRTKAMKKQLDGNMLWRRMLKEKNETGGTCKKKQVVKLNGKKLADMTPDERVEAMIKLNMI